MTSIQGTNTDFSSIASNWLYLDLDNCDKDYYTNVSVNFFKNMANINEPDTVSLEKRKQVLDKYLTMENTLDSLSSYNSVNRKKVSIYDLLQILNQKSNNNLTECIALINMTRFHDVIKGNYNGTTLFVFKNDFSSIINNWIRDLNPSEWYPSNGTTQFQFRFLRELLKYHTLNFKLYPSQLTGKKVEVGTLISDAISTYDKLTIESIDGKLYINLNKDYELENGVGYYPDYINRILIEKVVECDDGLIYIIEKPLIPILI